MLDSIDAHKLTEWMAFEDVEEEARKRAALAAKAESGVSNYKRRG